MILILAATADVTARRVRRWLRHAGADVLQLDCDDPVVELTITIDDDREEASLRSRSGRAFRLSEVDAFWYRRGELAPDPSLIGADATARARLREWTAMHEWLLSRLEARPSLGSWERETRCSKLEQLGAARALGVRIPSTEISTDRAHLRRAIRAWPRAVTKAIQAGDPVEGTTTTTALRPDTGPDTGPDDAPPRSFPRLAQERVERAIELRIFYLAGQTWTLAMIPRRGATPPVDVREAELDQSFHLVPYDLPAALRAELARLMATLKLDTGSIDMLVGPDGRHTFLEVNPSGQLDWLARALNAPIERAIAEHLLTLARAELGTEHPRSQVDMVAADARTQQRRGGAHRPPPDQSKARDERSQGRATPEADAAPDMSFVDAPQRFTWARGQRVLVRPLERPILRRLAAPSRRVAASSDHGQRPSAKALPEGPREAAPDICARTGPAALRIPASLQLVEGSQGALLYDLQRGKAFAVPLSLAPRLRDRTWPHSQNDAERRWLSAAEDALGLDLPPPLAARLPLRSLDWENPAAITSAVIDVDEGSSAPRLVTIFAALAEVECEHALLRIKRPDALAIIDRLLPRLEDATPVVLEIWLDSPTVTAAELVARVARWPRIASLIVFSAAEAGEWLSPRSGVGTILARTEALDLGAPSPPTVAEMHVSDELFRESIDHHPAFHRKLAIGPDGELRNAPGLRRSFGRFGERSLRDVIRDPEFQRLGKIHRGQIAGCAECEYRHACTDSREPILGADGRYHHQTLCTLDPRRRGRIAAGPRESAP